MLIKLKIRNFLSFKNEVVFSTNAKSLSELRNNTFSLRNKSYLKSIAIFGANAYGKTNLLKAFVFLRNFILNSYKKSLSNHDIGVEPFKFDLESNKKPSFFEITFFYKEIQYRYGLELDKKRIYREYLYVAEQTKKIKEKLFFKREDSDSIDFGSDFLKYKKALPIKQNVLFLTKLGLEYDDISNSIIEWVKLNFNIIAGYDRSNYNKFTREKIQNDPTFKNEVVKYLRAIESGIEDLEVRTSLVEDIDELPQNVRDFVIGNNLKKIEKIEKTELLTLHKKFNKNNTKIGFENLNFDQESLGIQQALNLFGPIIDTLQNGRVLIVDELESSIHPNVLKFIVSLFNSDKNNKNAQLIFTTHGVSLLDKNELGENHFRRDQVWFADKDEYGASSLFSLADFKTETGASVRKDENYLKNYLLGSYSAIPFIDDYLLEE